MKCSSIKVCKFDDPAASWDVCVLCFLGVVKVFPDGVF